MKKEDIEDKLKLKNRIINIAIILLIYGWLIYDNMLNLIKISTSLYSFVFLSSPFLIIVLLISLNKNVDKSNFFIMFIYCIIPLYIILIDSINQNYTHRISYNLSMIYIFVFINISIFILAKNVDMVFHYKLLKRISALFILLSLIYFIINGISANRFLNTNFTSFLIAQFIIVIICEDNRSLLDWIIFFIAIMEILAAGGRSSFIVIIFIIFIRYFKTFKRKLPQILISIIFVIIAFFSMKNFYYNYLKVNPKLTSVSRPIGFIVGDKDIIFDQSSNERIDILNEYLPKIIEKAPLSIIFGLGPKNFDDYSHNIIIDSIAFGGIFTLLINIFVLIKSIKLKRFNQQLFYQILFFFLVMMFTGTFITNIPYWGLVFLQQYKYNKK